MNLNVKEPLRWRWRKLLNYFVQGALILAPISITIWAVISFFNYIDNILPNLVNTLFPFYYKVDTYGNVQKVPGVGFVLIFFFIVLVGWFSTSFVVGKIVDFLGHLLERTPCIKLI